MAKSNESENENDKIDHINKTYSGQEVDRQIKKIYCVSVRQCLYVISNTEATFEAQFVKKLSNTEAESKKGVAYRKKRAIM